MEWVVSALHPADFGICAPIFLWLGVLSGGHLHVEDDAGDDNSENKERRGEVAAPGGVEGLVGDEKRAEQEVGCVEDHSGNQIGNQFGHGHKIIKNRRKNGAVHL